MRIRQTKRENVQLKIGFTIMTGKLGKKFMNYHR